MPLEGENPPRVWCGYDLSEITEDQFQRCVRERRLNPNSGIVRILRAWTKLPGPTEAQVLASFGRSK